MAVPGTTNFTAAWGTTVGIVAQPVMPANPTRSGLIIINAGATAIAVCPALVYQSVTGTYTTPSTGVPVVNGAGSVTMQPGDKFIFDNLACSTAWNGISAVAGGALTFLEFFG